MAEEIEDGRLTASSSSAVRWKAACAVLALACVVFAVLFFCGQAHSAELERQLAEATEKVEALEAQIDAERADGADDPAQPATRVITNTVTKEIVREVPVEVTKVVTEYVYVPVKEPVEPKGEGNLTYQSDVSYEQTSPGYWADRATDPDKVLLDAAGIAAANQAAIGEDTFLFDLSNMPDTFNSLDVRDAMASGNVPEYTLYLDGELLEGAQKEAYFRAVFDNIAAGEASAHAPVNYGIITKRAEMRAYPLSDFFGYSADDTDDEFVSTALNVGQPFIAMLTTGDGKYCWGYCDHCTGWIPAENVAFCSSKAEWLDAWQTAPDSKDILVVTCGRMLLEPSRVDASDNVALMLGTVLKLVPEDELPASVGQRSTWNNYVVYLPMRAADGSYVKGIALIPQSANVHVGYLPLTQRNLLNVAFSCLGNRYGWGGMADSMDCSMYAMSIYRCFGLAIPRNTSWICALPDCVIDLSGLPEAEKSELISGCPAGTILHFDGHEVIYVGCEDDGQCFAIGATGFLYESDGSGYVYPMSVVLTSLDVCRRSGSWLENIDAAVMPWGVPQE